MWWKILLTLGGCASMLLTLTVIKVACKDDDRATKPFTKKKGLIRK